MPRLRRIALPDPAGRRMIAKAFIAAKDNHRIGRVGF
jgi:hypothetical protein